jgi:S-formylglutathione hydrolase FrmB
MALLHCNFYSHVLDLNCSMDVILPDPVRKLDGTLVERTQPSQVLYLLHGLSDDNTIWQRRTSIERYMETYDLAVVMPAVDRSFYTDMAQGNRYWTFISEELPELVQEYFQLSTAREDTFAAGLSMGGYGAFKLALSHPDRFGAAASLSGAVDMAHTADREEPEWVAEKTRIFGPLDKMPGSEMDLLHLAVKLAESAYKDMPLFAWCGTEDFLYEQNLNFRKHANELNLNFTYEEGPGDHMWKYWDDQIQNVLAWLPLRERVVPEE